MSKGDLDWSESTSEQSERKTLVAFCRESLWNSETRAGCNWLKLLGITCWTSSKGAGKSQRVNIT